MRQRLTILGAGYTARFVLPLAEHRYARVLATSRDPDRHLSHIQPDRRIPFDLTQQDTWKNIPTDADLLWCFPATPVDLVKQCAATLEPCSRRLVVLGSTSAYDVPTQATDYPPPWIDETAPIDLSKSRVQGEEWLRKEHGAIVLRVAGIYGPGRNPIDWITNGRVGSSRKYVNLIHVEDLANICLAALERGVPGDAYNVSDGTPRTWTEICRLVEQHWGVHSPLNNRDDTTGKRLSNAKLLTMLGTGIVQLRHLDLHQTLQDIHKHRGTS